MTTETDSFTYSNGELSAVAGGNWTVIDNGGSRCNIVSNKLRHQVNGNAYYKWHTTFSSGTSLYSQMVFDDITSGWEMGPAVNWLDHGAGSPDGYLTIAYDAGGGSVDCFVNEYAAGAGVQLGSTAHPSVSAADVFKITNESGTIKVYQNGSQVSGPGGADATWSGATVGLYMDGSGAGAWQVDNWEGGDIAAAGGQPITKRLGGVQFTASRAPAQQGMRQF